MCIAYGIPSGLSIGVHSDTKDAPFSHPHFPIPMGLYICAAGSRFPHLPATYPADTFLWRTTGWSNETARCKSQLCEICLNILGDFTPANFGWNAKQNVFLQVWYTQSLVRCSRCCRVPENGPLVGAFLRVFTRRWKALRFWAQTKSSPFPLVPDLPPRILRILPIPCSLSQRNQLCPGADGVHASHTMSYGAAETGTKGGKWKGLK